PQVTWGRQRSSEVEQPIRNRQVVGSNPTVGSKRSPVRDASPGGARHCLLPVEMGRGPALLGGADTRASGDSRHGSLPLPYGVCDAIGFQQQARVDDV